MPQKPATLKMVVVDDEELIGKMISDFFAMEGDQYQVFTAMDGEAGWDLCQKVQPGFIITDLMLPKMSGIQLIKKLRGTLEFGAIPIIAITAGSMQLQQEAVQAGATVVMEKPLRRIALIQKVEELLFASPFLSSSSSISLLPGP
jgi:CheY-like chemotaxis protein